MASSKDRPPAPRTRGCAPRRGNPRGPRWHGRPQVSGRAVRVARRVALELPALVRQRLVEVTVPVEQPHPDQRDTENGRLPAQRPHTVTTPRATTVRPDTRAAVSPACENRSVAGASAVPALTLTPRGLRGRGRERLRRVSAKACRRRGEPSGHPSPQPQGSPEAPPATPSLTPPGQPERPRYAGPRHLAAQAPQAGKE